MTDNTKIPLGSPVIIDTLKSKYNLNNKLNREIAFMPEGILVGYSNEISGEFLIIRLRSDIEVKISKNDLSECTKNFYFKKDTLKLKIINSFTNFLNIGKLSTGNREIKFLFNPIYFLKWILYITKDIF